MDSLTRAARIYIVTVMLAGAALVAWQIPLLTAGRDQWQWLIVTGALAAVGQVLNVEGSTVRSSFNAGLAAYGFALLAFGLPAAVAVMLAACVIDWAWNRYPWYIQTFNIAAMALSLAAGGFAHWLVLSALGASDAAQVAAAIAASIVFVVGNHLAVGEVISLARGEGLRESGVFSRLTLIIDGALFTLGALTGTIWTSNPYALILAIVPLYPMYLVLRVPSLERQAVVDSKTGLFNSGYFTTELNRELERAQRFDRPLTVVLGDLDLLRNINNTFGHLAGDVVLTTVATILKESVREYDVVARFGGEEFAILMPETDPEDAIVHIDRIRARVAESEFEIETSVHPISATMSFGIAGRAGPEQSAAKLMHQADAAVYRAKLRGRNRVCLSRGADDAFVPFLDGAILTSAGPSAGDTGPAPSASVDVARLCEAVAEAASEPVTAAHPSSGTPEDPGPTPVEPRPDALSRKAVAVRIAGVATMTLAAFCAVFLLLPGSAADAPFLEIDRGLAIFALLALAAEYAALEIYARDTSVSTSAAILIAGAVLFGPFGALVLGVVTAGASMVRNHSAVSRFIFNASVHSLAGLIAALLTLLVVHSPASYVQWPWAVACLGSGLVYFGVTTGFVAWAISWAAGESAHRLWHERFRWLAPYYLGMGLAAYGLIFGYVVAGGLGLLVVVTPLVLLRLGQGQYVRRTKAVVSELRLANEGLTIKAAEVSDLSDELLMVVARAVDARDPAVVGHSRNVSRYAVLMAEEMGISGPRLEFVRKSGLLHDVGKLGISEAILFKPARLSRPEYEIIKTHSRLGAEILSESPTLRDVSTIVLHHHEHYDGGGYPDGLKGHDIPLEARIMAVADAVEAMASDRPYRSGMPPQAIIDEINANSGTQFDPAAVAAFCRVVERLGLNLIVNGGVHRPAVGQVDEPALAATVSIA